MSSLTVSDLWPIDPITDDEYAGRTSAVRAVAAEAGFDAVIAYSTAKVVANVRYLTSYYPRFSGHQHTNEKGYYMFGACAALIPLEGEPLLRTDALWDVVRAGEMSKYPDVDGSIALGEELGRAIADCRLKRVAIDNWFLFPAEDYLAMKAAAPDTEFVPSWLISGVRAVKSPAELERHRRAELIAVAAAQAGMDAVQPGANSATGSSLPTREKTIERGEWVLFDVLPKFDGYAGDIARMRFAGDPDDLSDELRQLHATTVTMNEEVSKVVKAGVTPAELNATALAVAEAEGLGANKIGLVGHATGLDIHDIPDYFGDDTPLRAGEVITIEPCLLKEGLAGTRIEDVVVVTEDGHELLTDLPRRLFPGEQR